MIDKLNLNHLIGKMLKELSGGDFQKVILARALAQQPKILILDKPTNNFDLANQMVVMNNYGSPKRSRFFINYYT